MSADLSSSDSSGVSPLFEACVTGNYDLAKDLIDAGAKVSGDLLFEVIGRSFENEAAFIELLLSKGAGVNHKLNDRTALQAAVAAEPINVETVKVLIKKGANIRDSKENIILLQPMTAAFESGNFAFIEALLGAKFWSDDRRTFPSLGLKIAVRSRSNNDAKKAHLIRLVLSKGADVDFPFDRDVTALHMACGYNGDLKALRTPNPELVRVLCEGGANLNAKDEYGRTALYVLCNAFGDTTAIADDQVLRCIAECAQILQERGAEVAECDVAIVKQLLDSLENDSDN